MTPPIIHNGFRFIFLLAIFWLTVGGLLLIQLWPDLPQSKAQWLLFIALGPPLYVFGEALLAWLFSPEHGRAVSGRNFSLSRIAVALPIGLAVFMLCGWLSWLASKP